MNPKGVLLNENGYRYNIYRMAYINRTTKKVFSIEAIEEHPVEWLNAQMAERSNGDWQFYFTEPPSAAVVRDYVAELDGRRAAS
ncbi:MAG: hypothetical protein QOC81_4974 [Thermoanaerobaculia bacterium]|jgi:hypothetical protein|nr:hypothetical protein [Thermoanaerobaculia bacterium]